MKKIKKAADEITFILTATPEELLAYVAEHPFRPSAEKALIARGLIEVILLYIERYGLQKSAATLLFKKGNNVLILCLLTGHKNKEIMEAFLDNAPYETVKTYVDGNPCPELSEQKALERFDEEELRQLLYAKKEMSLFAKCDILKRGSAELVADVIKHGGLQKREKDMVIYYGSQANVELLICLEKNRHVKQEMHEVYLIRFKRFHKLERLITKKRLCQNAERFFLLTPSPVTIDLLIEYVRHYRPKGGDRAILHHHDRSRLITYLSKNWLSEECVKLLLKRGRHKEVKAYIKTHILSPENEVKLVKRGKHHEIMCYLKHHTFSLEAGLELVKRGNASEIFVMATSQPLAQDVLDAIAAIDTPQMNDLVAEIYRTQPYPLL